MSMQSPGAAGGVWVTWVTLGVTKDVGCYSPRWLLCAPSPGKHATPGMLTGACVLEDVWSTLGLGRRGPHRSHLGHRPALAQLRTCSGPFR